MSTSTMMELYCADGLHQVQLLPPATMTMNTQFTFPATNGTAGQAAVTDGSGNLSYAGILSTGLDPTVIQVANVLLTSAQILTLNSVPTTIVAAPGAGKFIEFISGAVFYDFLTAAYTAGGNCTFNYHGQAAVSALFSAANGFANAASRVNVVGTASAAFTGALATFTNLGLDLQSSVEFTQPGTAAGTARVAVAYRIHSTL